MQKEYKKFKLVFPIPRTHCGIYMGNGNLGAMVWGDKNLHITVNKADFWDHRGGETLLQGTDYKKLVDASKNGNQALYDAYIRKDFSKNQFKPQRIPVGRFEFKLKNNLKLNSATLDYSSGQITITTKSQENIFINLSMLQDIILIEDKYNIIETYILKPSWEFDKSRKWLKKYSFKEPKIISQENIKGWIQACPNDPSLASICENINNNYFISLELGKSNNEALKNATSSIKKNTESQKWKDLNIKWWYDYWEGIPEIKLPEDFFNKFYKYALYKFASATSPNSNTPAGLQGPWIEEYQQAQWSGDYHFNVNVQEIYTLAFITGKLEHLMPLFDMIESKGFWKNMRHNAKVLLGIDDGLLLTHAVDDKGFQCGGITAGSTLDQACGGWTAQLYWSYYKYSLDKEFLKKRAYPFIYGVMRVYEEMLEEYNGKFSIPLSISAEYGSSNPDILAAGRDPSYQLSCIHTLTNALLKICKILKIEPRKVWKQIKEKLPHFTEIKDLVSKERRIAIWEGQDLAVCHRHHSHLACIYPFDSLPKKQTKRMQTIIDNSIDHWILMGMGQWSEWSIPWAAIIQTRLGLNNSPITLLNMWKEIFVNEGMNTVYLPRFRGLIAHHRHDMDKPKKNNEIMQLDGTMGCATSLLEMLAHTHSGITKLFYGIPDKWANISFKNIYLPGPFRISAEKKDGKFFEAEIESLGGKNIKIDILGTQKVVFNQKGKSIQITLPYSIKLSKGEKVKVYEHTSTLSHKFHSKM